MPTLWISEFGVGAAVDGFAPSLSTSPRLPAAAAQALATWPQASAALGATTKMVRLLTDTACSIEIGAAPDGTGMLMRLAPNVPERFHVSPGSKIFVKA